MDKYREKKKNGIYKIQKKVLGFFYYTLFKTRNPLHKETWPKKYHNLYNKYINERAKVIKQQTYERHFG